MFFEQDNITFKILDVLHLKQKAIKTENFGRNFDAISLRYKADSVIEYRGKQVILGDNTIGFFPANLDYNRTSKGDEMIVIHFKAFNYTTREIEKYIPDDINEYRLLFEKALRCWNEKSASYKYETASVLNLIFARLHNENKTTSIQQQKIIKSVEYIDDHCLEKNFELRRAAEKSYMSETHFRRLFKCEFGISPKQYVIKQRIQRAASLILAGYHSLKEVADECGYEDYKHFSVEFKRITGVSPSKYLYSQKQVFVDQA